MKNNLRISIFIALFAALISVGSYISINIGPVSIVLANFFIFLAGFILGFPWALASTALFLFVGLIGLPVFQNGGSGFAHFAGPTGGFLIGYLAAAIVLPIIIGKQKKSYIKDFIAVAAAILVIYAFGLPWLKIKLNFTWSKTFAVGFIPFVLIDAIKGVAAVLLARNVSFSLKR